VDGPPPADLAVRNVCDRHGRSLLYTSRESTPRQADGCRDHRPLLDRPGTAVVLWATTPLDTTETARASLTCPASSDCAVVVIVTTVN
jgi:hypothetical protein